MKTPSQPNLKQASDSALRQARRLVKEEDGVTAIEYGLLAALIVVAIIGSVSTLGEQVFGMWTKQVADAVAAAIGGVL